MPDADLVLFGEVLTMDAAVPRAAGVAVRGGRVTEVGERAAVAQHVGKATRVLELGDGVVLPGFHDAHVHLTKHGIALEEIDLSTTVDAHAGLAMVRRRALAAPPGTWLTGSGFALQRWGLDTLGPEERAALDAAAPDNPVLIRSQDHHSAWVNGAALRAARIDRHTPDPPNGFLARGADGEPTGFLVERAVELVRACLPTPGPAALRAALSAAGDDLAARGVTTVHHMAFEPPAYWRELALAASDPGYPLRVWACVPQADIEHAAALGVATGQGGDHFQVGGAKFFADGALGSRTAWMLEPYPDGGSGMVVDGPEMLAERFPLAIEAGLAPVTHAIGDAANRAVLDALERTARDWRERGLRPRIEHAQHLHPGDVERFARLGVTASMQPIHLVLDVDSVRTLLADREERAYPMRSLLDAGVNLAFGSDTPVAQPDVIAGLRAACRRKGPSGPALTPHQAIGVEEALAAYTVGAARAIGREGRSGRLAPGCDADLVALTGDPRGSLDEVAVRATFKAGRQTFGEQIG